MKQLRCLIPDRSSKANTNNKNKQEQLTEEHRHNLHTEETTRHSRTHARTHTLTYTHTCTVEKKNNIMFSIPNFLQLNLYLKSLYVCLFLLYSSNCA